MEYSEILSKFGNDLTPTQHQYLTKYIELDSATKVAEHFNRAESSVRRSLKAVRKRYNAKTGAVPEHMSENVPEPFAVDGYSAMYDQDGNRRIHWIKANKQKQQAYEDLREAMTDLAQELPKIPKRKRETKEVDPQLMTVYPLGDPHIGLLTYAPEVNNDWDLKIAEEHFLPLFDNLVKVAPPSKECLIVDLGDFWHYDAMDQRTTRSGHKVDADGRPSKMIQVGYRIMMQMIASALEHHEIVNVKVLPGNHDDLGSVFLRVSLGHIFQDNPRVNVHQSPNVFQYYSWGQSLIGIHHGDKCKMTQLPMVMAADEAQLWGATKFRYWYVGHFHHDSAVIHSGKEMSGCRVETFRTIVATEGYAHEAGYRSGQDGKAIVLHKEYGEIERYTVNIDQIR